MGDAPEASVGQRLAALVALLLVVAVFVTTVLRIVMEPFHVAGELIVVVVAVGGASVALTTINARRRWPRRCASSPSSPGWSVWSTARATGPVGGRPRRRARRCCRAGGVHAGRLGACPETTCDRRNPGRAATRASCSSTSRSGGGKAERFGIVDECTRRASVPVVLEPARTRRGGPRRRRRWCDVIGMAGGDGSQAMVGRSPPSWGCRWSWCRRAAEPPRARPRPRP